MLCFDISIYVRRCRRRPSLLRMCRCYVIDENDDDDMKWHFVFRYKWIKYCL